MEQIVLTSHTAFLWTYSQYMGIRLILIFGTALLCHGECVQVEVGPPQFGRVEVSAFSNLGERLSPLDIDLIEVGTNKSLKSKVQGAVATQVPYGTYLVRASVPGFRRSEREIHLDQPEVLVRMQLSTGAECAGFAEIRGSIHSAPANHELWVKLVALQGVGDAEAHVAQDGSFLFGGLGDGQYLLLVVDGKAIVHTESLTILRSSILDVDLAKN